MQGSHARILASPEIKQALEKVRGLDFTGKFSGLPMKYDRNTCSWKMSQQSLLSMMDQPCEQSLATLPVAGLMLSGQLYRLPKLALNTNATDGGVSHGAWATPNTMDSLPPKSPESLQREMTVTRPGRSKPANLRDQVSNMDMWATPQARDYRTGDNPDGKRAKRKIEQGWSQNLNDQVRMYPTPTPTTHNHKETGAPSQVNNRNTVQLGDLVVDAAMNSTTKDSENTDAQTVKAMRLNPRWVSWLMMWPVTWFDGTILKRKSGGSRTKSKTGRTS